ncbi:MAG: hypothetical protein ChlgKO_01330 [Chlamydiales bacterium]
MALELLEKLLKEKKLTKKPIKAQIFDEIVKLMEEEEALSAQKKIETLLKDKHLDIRIISFYSYIDFIENGIVSLSNTLPLLQTLLDEKWDELQPETLLEEHAQTSVNWLFSHIIKKLKYCEKLLQRGTKHPIWKKCEKETSLEQYDTLIAAIKTFTVFFQTRWPESQTLERIHHMNKRTNEMKRLFAKVEPEEEPIEEELPPPPEPEKKTELAPSKPFEKLILQLKTFEELIEKESYNKAAICARAITHEIEHFDPTHYFPEHFSNFFSLHAKHADTIARHQESQEKLQWKLLENLLKVDINAFIDWT